MAIPPQLHPDETGGLSRRSMLERSHTAGATSPWGTWLTCEEAESLTGQTKPHG